MNKKFLNAVLFGALLASSAGTFTSCKDYDDDIDGLQEQIDANQKTLDEKLATLQTALDAAKTELAAAKAAAAKAQETADAAAQLAAAAKEAAAQAKIDAIDAATKLVNDLKTVVNGKVDQSVYDAKVKLIDGQIEALSGRLTTAEGAISGVQTQIETLNGFMTSITALNLTEKFPELQGQVTTLIADLEALEKRVKANEESIDQIKIDMKDLSDAIDAVSTDLNTLISLLSQRLTALTFAPTQFINGIEVINFATLQYKPWTELLIDESDGETTTSINDGKTQAMYYASPSSVKMANIKSLTVLSHDATNTTRAEEVNPIITATIAEEIVAGQMIVNLKKNIEGSFNKENDPEEKNVENFTLVALQAEIELTAEEKEANIEPVVTSDWARLAETSETPYIHNTAYENDDTAEDLDDAKIPHFYPYTKIHDQAGKDAVCTTDGKYIVKSLSYKEPLDLNTLVKVCDKKGHTYNLDDYGLKFEFNLVDYYLEDEKEEKTNQKSFAKIDDKTGVITSCARNGKPDNRDAIGREPLVQIVLKNTANDEVVDVRYFKIAWTTQPNNNDLKNLGVFEDDYDCIGDYTKTVGTETMNDKVYAAAQVGGIRKEEFHELYTLDTRVYASVEDAIAGKELEDFGTLEDVKAEGSTTTHNIKWTIGINEANKITAAEYNSDKSSIERTVYGRYYRTSDPTETFTFNLTLALDFEKMALAAGYNETFWKVNTGEKVTSSNQNKVFTVNPALTSDAVYGDQMFYDCQIITSLLNGYTKGAAAITDIKKLVSDADEISLIFDADRLANLPQDESKKTWKVSDDGLQLIYGTEIAATITAEGVIRLYEDPTPSVPTTKTHGEPTAAAQLLLGNSVPVKLVAGNCMIKDVVFDKFLVRFINPLAMTVDQKETVLKDLHTGGASVDITNAVTIVENFGDLRKVWEKGEEATTGLATWYDVQGIYWDITNAKTNLKVAEDSGNITVSSDFSNAWSQFKDHYTLTADKDVTPTKLTFHNEKGSTLQGSFQVKVPVYVVTKWSPRLQDAEMMMVTLTIEPGNQN